MDDWIRGRVVQEILVGCGVIHYYHVTHEFCHF